MHDCKCMCDHLVRLLVGNVHSTSYTWNKDARHREHCKRLRIFERVWPENGGELPWRLSKPQRLLLDAEQNAYCHRITLSRFVMEEDRFGHRRVTFGRPVGSTGFCCTSSRHNFGIKSRYFVMRSCYSSDRCDASLDKWAVTNMRHIHLALYQGQHLLSRPGLKRLIATWRRDFHCWRDAYRLTFLNQSSTTSFTTRISPVHIQYWTNYG